jgi:hypothetical protein
MPDTSLYLSVAEKFPRLGWNLDVVTQPEIRVRFNLPVDLTLVQSDQSLNSYVVLVNLSTDQTHPVHYVDWDKTIRTLTFTPSGSLIAGGLYQVTIRKELKTAQGRGMLADAIWSFQVSDAPLDQVQLRSPGDATAWADPPALAWDGVWIPSGSVNYQVQIDKDWQFGSNLIWTTTITSATSGGIFSQNIGTTLEGRKTYFWRVRAYTPSVTGEWSATRAFFVGTATHPAPDTQQLYEPDTGFTLQELLPPDGTTHLTGWPTIRATFSQALSGETVSDQTFQLWSAPVDGRLDLATVQITGGTFTVIATGGVIVLVPPDTIQKNRRYTIRITKGLLSSTGESLPEQIESLFIGAYLPFYGGIVAVRKELGGFIDQVSDDEICFNMWRASLELHDLLDTQNGRVNLNVSLDDLINYQPPGGATWGMVRYVELTAAIALLEGYYYELLQTAGVKRALATFSEDRDVNVLDKLQKKIDKLTEDRDFVAARFLNYLVHSRATGKSTHWDPNPLNPLAVDLSYSPRRQFGRRKYPWDIAREDPNRRRRW